MAAPGKVLVKTLPPDPSVQDPNADPGEYPDPYKARLDELRQQMTQEPKPLFTPEQQIARQYANDKDYKLGMLMAIGGGGEGLQQTGGQLFKHALSQRSPTVTERGAYDPLTGTYTLNPEAQQEKHRIELGRVEDRDAAGRLNWATGRQAAAERRAAAAKAAQDRKDLHLLLGLGGDEDSLTGMVDALGTYKLDPSQAFARMAPAVRAKLIEQTQAKYPGYDPTTYAAKKAAAQAFTTGTQGNALRSFAVAGAHLTHLDSLIDALNNGNVPMFNKFANAWAQQTGDPAPTNFDAAKDIVSKEVVKAIVAGGGGVAERQELSDLMKNANSPQQLKGVITHYRTLMGAQHDALLTQRRAAGLPDETRPNYYNGEPSAAPGQVDPVVQKMDAMFPKR